MQVAKGFKEEELSAPQAKELKKVGKLVRSDVLKMTRLAGGGPVGGAFSVSELLVTLMASADVDSMEPDAPGRDRILLSHEQATPAYYAALGRSDFFDLEDAVCLYKRAGSIFEGRPERGIPGVEWCCGNPGQGLAAACGLALASRWSAAKPNIFVVMSDEEQQCGQIAEARRFAKKYRLNNITAIIDANNVQAAGKTSEVMPQNLKYEYIADGWDVIEINGHDPAEIYQAVRRASQIQSTPVLVLANTVMGSGVSFLENQPEYYARGLTVEEYEEAMRELGSTMDVAEGYDYRSAFGDFDFDFEVEELPYAEIETGEPRTYGPKERLDNVEAFGAALCDVGNVAREGEQPLAVFDCAKMGSLGLAEFAQKNHDRFIQCGLGGQSAATVAAAMSGDGLPVVLAGYGVDMLTDVFNQLRLADINRANLKVVATRLGLDAGSDGKAMHCVEYMGLAANLFGFKLVIPADANHTDRAMRYMLEQPGNWILGLGRSETPVITDEAGKPLFAGDYQFEYGEVVSVRPGEGGVIIATGQMLPSAIEAWSILNREGNAPSLLYSSCPLSMDIEEPPLLLKELRKGRVVTFEDHNSHTGLGACIANLIARRGISCRLMKLGVDRYSLSGDADDLYRWMGMDVETLVEKTRKFLKR